MAPSAPLEDSADAPSPNDATALEDVIDLTLSDDDDSLATLNLGPSRKRLKQDPGSQVSFDDVEIVLPEPRNLTVAVEAELGTGEVQFVGAVNETRLPHARHNCTEHPFSVAAASETGLHEARKKYCDMCYCYVCDTPAGECKTWLVHCRATDQGPQGHHWKQMRLNRKSQCSNAVASYHAHYNDYSDESESDGNNGYDEEGIEENSWNTAPELLAAVRAASAERAAARAAALVAAQNSYPGMPQTYAPNDRPPNNTTLTACQHCGWWNRFSHKNFSPLASQQWYGAPANRHTPQINPTGPLDWCGACGRVASSKDYAKAQLPRWVPHSPPVVPPATTPTLAYHRLGMRVIPFHLHTHDPRKIKFFADNWKKYEGNDPKWHFDEAAMQKELFHHRFGRRPTLEMIVGSIPTLPVEKLTGEFFLSSSGGTGKTIILSELQGLLLDNPIDTTLLQELFRIEQRFGKDDHPSRRSCFLDGSILAFWDETTGSGVFHLEVFVNTKCQQSEPADIAARTNFFAAWARLSQFSLEELGLPMEACNPKEDPGTVDRFGPNGRFDAIFEVLADKILPYLAAQTNATATLESGNNPTLGGVCTNETDMRGVLKKYYCSILPDIISRSDYSDARKTLLEAQSGPTHSYRRIRTSEIISVDNCKTSGHPRVSLEKGAFEYVLNPVDYAFCILCLKKSASNICKSVQSLNGLFNHMESLGHAEAPFVDGLTVELLPFQKQALQWASERELLPGGLQRQWIVQIPNSGVYYDLLRGTVQTNAPKLVRGGILAAQMGLGKTVITLALILMNPAPPLPLSGNHSKGISKNPDRTGAFWNPEPVEAALPIFPHKKLTDRGSILSRGTLVICNVSLVGQWIDEAKSKLTAPGLVYAYHGQSRNRNSHALAQNAIIVTTYETLASDYRRAKGQSAPCAKIRFWRIVCDESHVLRNSNNKKSAAVENLVADHKWLVSGTPVNTTLNDLKNQLKFIGVENIAALFNQFTRSVYVHIGDYSRPKGRNTRYSTTWDLSPPFLGHFMFFMRSIMLRYSQAQRYKNSSTTLMSLPSKVERSVTVKLSERERAEYHSLEEIARKTYLAIRSSGRVGRSYLRLTQALLPLRVACSGGRVPEEVEAEPDLPQPIGDGRKEQHKKTKLSEFAFTSKLEALVSELKSMRDKDDGAKSLVFSQFGSTLDWLKTELPKHGFQYRTLSGDMTMKKRAKALHEFQNDPPTTIFLLSMRAGAVGINLTQANHVFILEPCFNPALEAQAIGRVHRLGQTRKVEVIRMFVENSVESRARKMLEEKYGRAGGQASANSGTAGNNGGDGRDDDKKPAAKPTGSANTAPNQPIKQDPGSNIYGPTTAATLPSQTGADGDKKPAAKPSPGSATLKPGASAPPSEPNQTGVGSLTTDKNPIVREEMDILFGVDAAAADLDEFGSSDEHAEDDNGMEFGSI